jgi:L-lactate dehydrogenase complex protein LldE
MKADVMLGLFMRAYLFSTCLVDTFSPETGLAVIRLLRHFGVEVVHPKAQTCCGKPSHSGGHRRPSRKAAEHFLSLYEGEDPIVIPSGSCASMVKNHYPGLFGDHDPLREKALATARRTYELTEFLVRVLKAHQRGLNGTGRIAYHPSCQLVRELGIREEPIMLLSSLRGASVVPLAHAEQCCGFGGIFMARLPEVSMALSDEKAVNIAASGADTVTGCDLGCLMNIAHALKRRGSKVKVRHIAEVLAEGIP